jgi:hypothetical protein
MTLGQISKRLKLAGTLGAPRRQLAMTLVKGTFTLTRAFPAGATARHRGWSGCGTTNGRAPRVRAWRAPFGREQCGARRRQAREMLTMGYAATFLVALALKSHSVAALGHRHLRNPFTRQASGRKSIRHPYKKTKTANSLIENRPRIPSIVMFDTNGSCR